MSGLRILVCAKQVPDPEGPPSSFVIDAMSKRVIPSGIPPVINPFDENALELALRVKERYGARITVLSAGSGLSRTVLRKVLAVGADELVLLEDPEFSDLDSPSTASVLAAGIRKLGRFDLFLAGRQASDTNAGQVGILLAEMLRVPCINLAFELTMEEDGVRIKRVVEGGFEEVRAKLPLLLTVSSEVGKLRAMTLKQMREAMSKPIHVMSREELGLDPSKLRKTNILELSVPRWERKCVLIEGGTPEEAGANLALRLRADKVL